MEYKLAKLLYTRGCNEYLRVFCERHDFDFNEAKKSWVGDRVGEVVLCGDYYVDFRDIIVDVEEDPSDDEYFKYYNYCIQASEIDLPCPNYKSWLHGCPRASEERLRQIRVLRKSLNDLIKEEKENLNTLNYDTRAH